MVTALRARVARVLNLRPGEGRVFVVMGGFLLLTTANATFLSAAKNGLFLSVYPADLVPYAVIAGALVTSIAAVVFAGVVGRATRRRNLASGLAAVVAVALLGSRIVFGLNERSSFALYLVISAVQVLIMTHAWDHAGSLLTGRQGKRLLPLIGMGASVGAIIGGGLVVPVAATIGTSNMLLISALLLLGALPLLWAVAEPARDGEGEARGDGGAQSFLAGAVRGFGSIGREPLLRLMALGVVALAVTGTFLDLQLKIALQEAFARDQITAVYGGISSVVGAGTLILQFWASRVLFPKFGVSFAALVQGGALAFGSGGAAVLGGWFAFAGALALDDVMQFGLQRSVEQVSLLPFHRSVKTAAAATLTGVARPVAKASAGAVTLLLVDQILLLRLATVASAAIAFAVFLGHRRRYLEALESALTRHAVDFGGATDTPLVVDKEALGVIDRGLADRDSTVVVFAASLLEQLPAEEAVPRAAALLRHDVPEVRAEAARVLGRLDTDDPSETAQVVLERLEEETSPFVLSSLLDTAAQLQQVGEGVLGGYLSHESPAVRRSAIVALGRQGWPDTGERLRTMLRSQDSTERSLAATATGTLGRVDLIEDLAAVLDDDDARPAALRALSELGPPAIPVLSRLLEDRSLALPLRRSIVSTLAAMDAAEVEEVLMDLIDEPALGPAALTSLGRMRNTRRIDAIEPERLRPCLEEEIRRGGRFTRAAAWLRRGAGDDRSRFVAEELEGLSTRAVHRVLGILALSFDNARISAVSAAVLSADISRRSNALELLEGLLPVEWRSMVMPFLDGTQEGNPESRTEGRGKSGSPLDVLLDEPEWWPRALALHALGRDLEIATPGRWQPDDQEDADMIPLIEKVMILKGSQLFRSFPGHDLAGIAALAEEVHVEAGRTVFEEGATGDAFYMIVSGAVRITRGSHELARLGAREGFGEMAILDQETRSATVTADEPTTLLRIDRDSFDRLIDQNPAVARGIYRVLTRRLRNTLAQVAAG